MTPDKYKQRRILLGHSQASLAKELGVTSMTIKRRESGEVITREAELAIRAIKKRVKQSHC
jgi:DNA-binding XRE family transcriptional regulator